MLEYQWKPLSELYWGVTVAAVVAVLQVLVTLDPEKIVDWQAWLVALGAGAVRAAAGFAVAWFTGPPRDLGE